MITLLLVLKAVVSIRFGFFFSLSVLLVPLASIEAVLRRSNFRIGTGGLLFSYCIEVSFL